jgi:hypothetical protein
MANVRTVDGTVSVRVAKQHAHCGLNAACVRSIAYASEGYADRLRVAYSGQIHGDLIARDAEVADTSRACSDTGSANRNVIHEGKDDRVIVRGTTGAAFDSRRAGLGQVDIESSGDAMRLA